jgi:hypothetical protein
MIIFQSTAKEFIDYADRNQLIDKIQDAYQDKLGWNIPPSERSAYQNSLPRMATVLRLAGIPDDCGILIEFMLPLNRKRIDLVVTGKDENGDKNFLIIELKQWQSASLVETGSGLVETFIGQAKRVLLHPSEQSLRYCDFMSDLNEDVANGFINVKSCAYLHNYKESDDEPLTDEHYKDIVEQSPVFFADDQSKLEEFIKETVGSGDGMSIIEEIAASKYRPTKKLVDYISSVMNGRQEYVLLDEQKIALETTLAAVNNN